MIINNSANKSNWSQLKNQNEPLSTCNVTACINAAQSAGHDVMSCRKGLADRPSDDLLLFIRSNLECVALWKSIDRKGDIPINQWMAVLALGLAKWLGNWQYASFEMTYGEKMRDCIINGGACVVSGHYKTTGNDIDHITALVGVDYEDNTGYVNQWIMDDSYGDFRTKYESKNGNDIPLTPEQFLNNIKEVCSTKKRCIFVPKKGSI